MVELSRWIMITGTGLKTDGECSALPSRTVVVAIESMSMSSYHSVSEAFVAYFTIWTQLTSSRPNNITVIDKCCKFDVDHAPPGFERCSRKTLDTP
jgi:hypothetical protein